VPTPGDLIRARRRAQGITQAQLALRAGTTQAAISRLERDKVSPTVDTLMSLLAVMGEAPVLASERMEPPYDREHMRAALVRSPDERLELAISWNRLAGNVARAGETSRRQRRKPAAKQSRQRSAASGRSR
jgi:transcriptional regulator with XRE-family HTH domain